MAKRFTVTGLVRSAEVVRRTADNSPFGTRLGVLSEPDGDTVDVLIFDRLSPTADALALRGLVVTVVVDVEPRGKFLDCTAVKVVAVEAPAPLGALAASSVAVEVPADS